MTIKECHYDFKLKMDRIDTLSKQDFNDAEIDWLIYEASLVFLKQRTSYFNKRREGFEASQKRIDDLSSLVIKYPLQPDVVPISLDAVYEVKLATLAYPYYQLISGSVNATVGNCDKRIKLRAIQHDDLQDAIEDPFNTSSSEFILFNFGRDNTTPESSSLYLYADFIINSVRLEYIKRPNRVFLGTYTFTDGISYPPTDLEFPEHTHTEIVDIATQIASLNIENPEYLQLKQAKVAIQE